MGTQRVRVERLRQRLAGIPQLSFRPGQHACFYLFLDHCEIFRKTIAEHCSDKGFAPSITCDKAPFFSAPFNICEQMRRAEVAHKIEMHPENLAGTGRDTFKFLALASAQIRSGCQTLQPRHFNVRDAFGAPVNPIGIKRDVSHRVDAFFVRLQVLIDRTSARAAQWGVGHKLQIGFRPNGDYGESGRKSHPAFGLDILDHRFPFESIQIFTEQQLDSGLQIGIGQPLCALGVEQILPDDFISAQQAELCAGTRSERRRLPPQGTRIRRPPHVFRLKGFPGLPRHPGNF